MRLAIALVLALVATAMASLAYALEHEAAASSPPLTLRHPLQSLRVLAANRGWVQAFMLETGGFGLYATALALAPLALVQSVGAGGVGLLAVASARLAGRPMSTREVLGAVLGVVGLLFLALSLSNGSAGHDHGALAPIALWLAASTAVATVFAVFGGRLGGAAAYGIAGGLLLSVGDISTKLATQGGARIAFVLPLVACYVIGTSLLQIGYQRGGALTIAGIATLLTNALPIAAGTAVLGEPLPGGYLGALRVLAFAFVVAGALVLARPKRAPGAPGADPDSAPSRAVRHP